MLCRSAPSVANDQSGGNRGHCNDLQRPPDCQTNYPTIYKCYSSFSVKWFTFPTCWCFSLTLQATPQLTDRTKVLDILDPCLQETANVKHLHQVRKQKDHRPDRSLDSFYRSDWKVSISPKHPVIEYYVWVTSSILDVKISFPMGCVPASARKFICFEQLGLFECQILGSLWVL